MTYYLGIDLGTTYTAAAVWRDGRVEIASLGTRTPVVPSVVLLRDDGTFLTGEAAARRAVTEPERVAREFKRRFGDPTPIMVGRTPFSADALTARLLRSVVDHVTEREGERPAGTAVSHPANWGPFKQDLLRQVFRLADLDRVTTVTEPEAAAIHYASQERVDAGDVVAVYDLGGGTFDAAVLRRTGDGWEVIGEPEGVERLGGIDFDQAVFHHVSTAIGGAADGLDPDDPTAVSAMARLRQECVEAKEALSSDVDATIPVLLPTIQTKVRLTRAELEGMIRPALADSIGALRRALASADVEPEDVRSVLLVGGSSRLPLVAQLVGSELRRPVAVDAHPKHGVSLGAAIIAAERGTGRSIDTEVVPSIETIRPLEAEMPAPSTSPVVTPVAATAVPAGAADAAPAPEAQPAAVAQEGASTAPPTVHVPAPPIRRTVAPPTDPAGTGDVGARTSPPSLRATKPSSKPKSRPIAAIVGGLVLAAALVIAGIILTNDNDNGNGNGGETSTGDDQSNDESTDTSGLTTTTAPTTTTAAQSPAQTASLDDVTVADGQYLVTYTWNGFEPIIDGQPDSRHFHFYLNTTAAENAGTNGNPPGDWHLTDAQGEFVTKYGPANRGEATQMCVVVANGLHEVVDPASGNCLDLPE